MSSRTTGPTPRYSPPTTSWRTRGRPPHTARPRSSTIPTTCTSSSRPEIVSYYRQRRRIRERVRSTSSTRQRVLNPGPLITDYPHAGILNTTAFLYRYPTTATNRNRARSRWTWYHFLGLDIEKSASRTTDPDALADTNNPTLLNPACTVCHTVLDPTAGTFQNYGDEGYYKDKWGGHRLHRRLLQERGRDDSGAPGRLLAEPGDADLVGSAFGGRPRP